VDSFDFGPTFPFFFAAFFFFLAAGFLAFAAGWKDYSLV
jgi:hypothetical protein